METQKVKKCPFCGRYHDAASKFCDITGKDIEFVDIIEIEKGKIGEKPMEKSEKRPKEKDIEHKGGENVEEEEEFKAEFVPVEGMEPGAPPQPRTEAAGASIMMKIVSPLLLILGFGLFFVLGFSGMMTMTGLKTLCVFLEILAFGVGLAAVFAYYRQDASIVATNMISAVLALLVAGFIAFL